GSIWFYNDSIGWGVGGAGKIMHTTTGGQPLVIIENLNGQVADNYKLYQNFPNPFNTMTNVKFQMSKSGVVEIKVFDLLGREVKTLINEYKQPGTYQVSFNAEGLTSGIYFYKMTMGDFSETKKLVFAK
ncbi:MAG: T9SS type A sorting domain-containing protein, partial [Ignavibacteria bacterium]|nr:T9SS type A sorting domain-containing protein [Ignavibacteria bacterium]